MKAIFHKCYDDYGNLKDNALNIAYNLGKKEGLRKGKKIARAEVIEEVLKNISTLIPFLNNDQLTAYFNICDKIEQLKEQKNE